MCREREGDRGVVGACQDDAGQDLGVGSKVPASGTKLPFFLFGSMGDQRPECLNLQVTKSPNTLTKG
jgi:hypothetical protein